MNLQNLQMEDSGPIQIDEQATDGNINEKIETDTEYSLPVSTSNANNEEPEVQEHEEEVKSQFIEVEISGQIKELVEEQSAI